MPRDEDQSDRSICAKEQGKKKTNTNTRATAHWALIRAMLHLVFDKNRKKNFCPWQRLFVSVFTALIFTCMRSAGITPINAFAKKYSREKEKVSNVDMFRLFTIYDWNIFWMTIIRAEGFLPSKAPCRSCLGFVRCWRPRPGGGSRIGRLWNGRLLVLSNLIGKNYSIRKEYQCSYSNFQV